MNLYCKIFVIYISAFLMSFIAIKYLLRIAIQKNIIDHPDARKIHKVAIPRLGGVGICLGVFLAFSMVYFAEPISHLIFFILVTLFSFIIAAIGLADDLFSLKARYKFFVQIVLSCAIVMNGFYSPILGLFLSAFFIVSVSNAVNLIDGLDGLAGGIACIAFAFFLISGVYLQDLQMVLVSGIVLASTLAFLKYNIFPARIFMGDCGSLFLGLVLAILSIRFMKELPGIRSVLISLLVLGVPVFDTSIAVLRRFWVGHPIFYPDRGHFHHRLLDKGISHPRSVFILHVLSLFFMLAGLWMLINEDAIFVALPAVAIVSIAWLYYLGIFQSLGKPVFFTRREVPSEYSPPA